MKPDRIKLKATEDYRRGDRLGDIALRYGISIGTVSLWAKQCGLARRTRGCRVKRLPSQLDMGIVAAVRAVKDGVPTLKEIGVQFGGFSRANVHRIYHKWKDWKPRVPFKVGDVVRVLDSNLHPQDYEVLVPDVFQGQCKHVKTGALKEVKWVSWVAKKMVSDDGKSRSKSIRVEAVKVGQA